MLHTLVEGQDSTDVLDKFQGCIPSMEITHKLRRAGWCTWIVIWSAQPLHMKNNITNNPQKFVCEVRADLWNRRQNNIKTTNISNQNIMQLQSLMLSLFYLPFNIFCHFWFKSLCSSNVNWWGAGFAILHGHPDCCLFLCIVPRNIQELRNNENEMVL